MNTVFLQNPGEIDLRAIEIMGVNVKEGKSPIGYFGTGLKYAIAVLLRSGHSISIHIGTTEHKFLAETESIRGKDFSLIKRQAHGCSIRLGFTTELGKNWEMWMAMRELYSNCLDEGGQASIHALEPQEGTTTIVVQGQAFFNEFANRNKYFLQTKPLYEGSSASIHPGPSQYLYYRGVRVRQLDQQSAYTYNITGELTLTEDRTLSYDWTAKSYIGSVIADSEMDEVIRSALAEPRVGTAKLFEQTLDFEGVYFSTMSKTSRFVAVAKELGPRCRLSITTRLIQAGLLARELASYTPTKGEAASIAKAKTLLRKTGLVDGAFEQMPIHVVKDLGENVQAQAKGGEITLTAALVQRGTKYIASTLLEEFLHIEHHFRDESYEFQTYLLDKIIALACEAHGEVL